MLFVIVRHPICGTLLAEANYTWPYSTPPLIKENKMADNKDVKMVSVIALAILAFVFIMSSSSRACSKNQQEYCKSVMIDPNVPQQVKIDLQYTTCRSMQ